MRRGSRPLNKYLDQSKLFSEVPGQRLLRKCLRVTEKNVFKLEAKN
jgi:hypothetical protein